MEDILASIKRIIADDGAAVTAAPSRARRGTAAESPPAPSAAPMRDPTQPPAGILELTDAVREPAAPEAAPLLSDDVASASRNSLDALSAMVVRPQPAAGPATVDTALEGLVRELLRPVLKDWLDARLPAIVETMVAREIARITGRPL